MVFPENVGPSSKLLGNRDLYPSYLAARAEFDSKSDLVTQYFEKGLVVVVAVAAVSTKWIKRRLMVAASVGFGFGQPDLGSALLCTIQTGAD